MPDQPPEASSPYLLETAKLSWQHGDVPQASSYQDIYFSTEQGLAETRYVFLQHNQLEARWQQLSRNSVFCIGETGFGSGLNFLAAWQLWRKVAPADASLHFISVEKHPLTRMDLQRALSAWPELTDLAQSLIEQYPLPIAGQHLLYFDNHRVTLQLLFGDGYEGFEQLRSSNHPRWQSHNVAAIDAWFLDGFTPAKNPALWDDKLLSVIADLSATGSTLATFTAAGNVRRSLTAAGFDINKARGHRKREMLYGTFSGSSEPANPSTTVKGVKAPWSVNPQLLTGSKPTKTRHVAIIGGGLAGATSAFAMARRGWQVSLIEREPGLAQAASGNPQGMLYTKLSPEPGTLNRFTLSSYLHALRYYRQLLKDGWLEDQPGTQHLNFCGVLQLASTDKELKLYRQLQSVFAELPELVQFVDAAQASAIAAIELRHPGLFYPQAGWVSPPRLCRALTKHANIKNHFGSDIQTLTYDDNQWQLVSNTGQSFNADAVIIANSRDAQRFSQTAHLPLKTIRGQITLLPSTSALAPLQTVLCHEGYLTPVIGGQHNIGATFDNNDCDTELRSDDHRRNLISLQRALPQLSEGFNQLNPEQLQGRAGLRCTSPDYMPIAGAVPEQAHFFSDYAQLSKNAHTDIASAGRYYPNLYLNVGHGSRGLTSTPLCSEIIASMLNREPPPLARNMMQALNPARFIIRDLIRNNPPNTKNTAITE